MYLSHFRSVVDGGFLIGERYERGREQVPAAECDGHRAGGRAARAELQAAYQRKAAKLTEQNKAYNAFCDETGQKPLRERLQIAGWDRQQAAQAAAAGRKEVEKYSEYHYNGDGTISVTDDWTGRSHPHLPDTYKPYAVIDTVSQGGKQRDRMLYGPDARQVLQINGGAHGNLKKHPFGQHGEHAHDVIWEEDRIINREPRELTDQERKEHKDIL